MRAIYRAPHNPDDLNRRRERLRRPPGALAMRILNVENEIGRSNASIENLVMTTIDDTFAQLSGATLTRRDLNIVSFSASYGDCGTVSPTCAHAEVC
jgi:hypothetical protein